MSNNSAENIPPNGTAYPKGGGELSLPQKGGNVCVTATVFIAQQPKFTRTCRSIVPLMPLNMPPSPVWPLPLLGAFPQKDGNLCTTATVFIAQQPKFTRTCRSIVSLMPHNMFTQLGPIPPFWGIINPRKWETIGHLRRALLPNPFGHCHHFDGYKVSPWLTQSCHIGPFPPERKQKKASSKKSLTYWKVQLLISLSDKLAFSIIQGPYAVIYCFILLAGLLTT